MWTQPQGELHARTQAETGVMLAGSSRKAKDCREPRFARKGQRRDPVQSLCAWLCGHLDLGLQAFRTVNQYISIVSSHLVVVPCSDTRRKQMQLVRAEEGRPVRRLKPYATGEMPVAQTRGLEMMLVRSDHTLCAF